MKKIILLSIIIVFITSVKAALITVLVDYNTIQQAIDASADGDTIEVLPGTYSENINFRGRKILLTSLFYLNNDTSYISSTIINGSTPAYPDTASCVIFNSDEDSTSILQGFTITGGQGTLWLDIHGAGIYREGGGVLIELSSPVVRFNRIINNYATNTIAGNGAGGGGLRIGDGNPQILNNVIAFNNGRYGPGIVLNYTGCIIKNNLICYNSGGQSFNGGGAIWASHNLAGTPKIIENNTIYGNHATVGTGGILSQTTNVIVRNNILWANTSPGGTQVYPLGGGTASVTYSDVQGGYTGSGNINFPPNFQDTVNFYLTVFSPCVDAGDSSTIYNDIEDTGNPGMALLPSLGTVRNDMGAYGGQGAAVLGGGITTDVNGHEISSFDFTIFPNPTTEMFNVQGIKFNVEKIEMMNVTGETVMEIQNSGSKNSFDVNVRKLNAGIYFVRIYLEEKIFTKKIVLE